MNQTTTPQQNLTATQQLATSPYCGGTTAAPAAALAVAPGAPAPAPPPPNPAVLAEQFWQTIPLPVPKPSIPPGYAITGKLAYLVTGGTVAPAPFSEQTPLGPLTVTAHGSYSIGWGDGATTGPFGVEGTGYPSGVITHVYDNTGSVTVVIYEAWTATWSLGAAAGTLDQLHTDAVLANFAVRQIQAVLSN